MILAILLVLLHVTIDWYLIEKKNIEPNHTVETIIFLLVVLVFTMVLKEPMFIALTFAIRFLLFDPALNLSRKKKWNHLGTKARMDKILKWINKWIVLGLRVLVFLLACYFYY